MRVYFYYFFLFAAHLLGTETLSCLLINLIAIRCFCIRVSYVTRALECDRDKTHTRDTMSHFLRKRKRAQSHAANAEAGRAISLDGRESLKDLRGTPLSIIRTSVNVIGYRPSRMGDGGGEGGGDRAGRESRRATRKMPPHGCGSRLREISTSDTSVLLVPGGVRS